MTVKPIEMGPLPNSSELQDISDQPQKTTILQEIPSFLEMVEVFGAVLFPDLAAAPAVHPAVDHG